MEFLLDLLTLGLRLAGSLHLFGRLLGCWMLLKEVKEVTLFFVGH